MKPQSAASHRFSAAVLCTLIVISLAHAQTVFTGIVVDSTGTGIAGTKIEFIDVETYTLMQSVETDANGEFALSEINETYHYVRLEPPSYPIQYYSPDRFSVSPQYGLFLGYGGDITFKITTSPRDNPPDNSLAVFITDSSGNTYGSVDALAVLIRKFDKREFLPSGYNTDGSFQFDTLRAADFAIEINGNGFPLQYYHSPTNSSSPLTFISVGGGVSQTQTVVITQQPIGGGLISGTCQDGSGNYLSGITVSLCEPVDTFPVRYSQTTDTKGFFEFQNIEASGYYLKLSGGSYPDQWFSPYREAPTQYPEGLLYQELSEVQKMHITLSNDPVENPLSSVVKFFVYDENGNPCSIDKGMIFLMGKNTNNSFTPGYDAAEGCFIIENIPLDGYGINCIFDGYPDQCYAPSGNTYNPPSYFYALIAGESPTINIQLTQNPAEGGSTVTSFGYITGYVRDSTGSGIVAAVHVYDRSMTLIRSSNTSNDGHIQDIRVPARQELYIGIDGPPYPYQYWSHNGTPSRSPTNENIVVVLPESTFVLEPILHYFDESDTTIYGNTVVEGIVYDDETDAPVTGIRIVLFDDSPDYDINPQHFWSPWVTYTDDAGRYRLENIPAGTYRCMAQSDTLNYKTQFYNESDYLSEARYFSINTADTMYTIKFRMHRGGAITGRVVTTTGSPISDARVDIHNPENSLWFEGLTGPDGYFTVAGIPGGTWNVWVNHDHYMHVEDGINREYYISERDTFTVETFRMEEGGHIRGTFTSPASFYDSAGGYLYWGNGHLFKDHDDTYKQTIHPDEHTGLHFEPNSDDGTSGVFISDAIRAGAYRIIYTPQPVAWNYTNQARNQLLLPSTGYSFLTFGSSSTGAFEKFVISSGDTLGSVELNLREGYSIFGTIHHQNGTQIFDHYNVNLFVKIDSAYYLVSYHHQLDDGRFELPGLIDGEDYYLSLSADGYPNQFLGPSGNTAGPKWPFHFETANYKGLSLTLEMYPEGINPDEIPSPISIWIEDDSLGYPLIAWESNPIIQIDNYTLYSSDRYSNVTKIFSVEAASATTTTSSDGVTTTTTTSTLQRYRDLRSDAGWREYMVVGTGANLIVRSHTHGYDSRYSAQPSDNSLWLEVFGDRWGVQLEWGGNFDMNFSDRDSVEVYKSVGGEAEKLIFRRPAWETWIHDHTWDHDDTGATYTYHVELPSRNLVSPKESIILDDQFFASLATVHNVGPYEKYQRISDAIAAAKNFDHIEVSPGTYKENISFGGKILSMHGRWDYGKPPVIDGGGGIAVTIPVCSIGKDWEKPNINGFHIRNSSIGIKSSYGVSVDECLFENVTVALSMTIDSAAHTRAIHENPFISNTLEGYANHCTFIASRSGNLVTSVSAAGIAEQADYSGPYSGIGHYFVTPCVSLSSRVRVERSSIAFYKTKAQLSSLPVTLRGVTSGIEFERCNLWETSDDIRYSGISLREITGHDPQFADSTTWFVAETSPLAGNDWETSIGYDSRRYSDYKDEYSDEERPSAVKNIRTTVVGLNRVLISWSASPAEEKITRYRIYRAPGDASLYYINAESQWNIKIEEEKMFTLIDSFSTTGTAFLDTTVPLGKSFLYVVAAVNGEGNEGEIRIPAPPDISTYFVNTIQSTVKFAAGKWHMIGVQGGSPLPLGADSRHVLYEWDDKRAEDKLLSQYKRATQLSPAKGYWFKPETDTALTMGSSALSALKSVESSLKTGLVHAATGWNLVSSPFPFAVRPSWLGAFTAWEWNPDSIGYRQASVLKPWKAYWVYTERDTALRIWEKQTLSYYLRNPLAKAAASQPLWSIRLSLQNGGSFDTDNFIGAVPNALSKSRQLITPEPPAPFGGAQLFIIDHLAGKNGSGTPQQLAKLYKPLPKKGSKLEWMIGISPSATPSCLRVSDLEQLPDDYYIFWVEKERVCNLRESDSVMIASGTGDRYGYIVITRDPADLGLYTSRLMLRTPYPNPFRGTATIDYMLPYAWADNGSASSGLNIPFSLSLYDITGRHIVKLGEGKRAPGKYTTVWNGENSSGGQVAAGMYIMRLQYGKQSRVVRLYRIR